MLESVWYKVHNLWQLVLISAKDNCITHYPHNNSWKQSNEFHHSHSLYRKTLWIILAFSFKVTQYLPNTTLVTIVMRCVLWWKKDLYTCDLGLHPQGHISTFADKCGFDTLDACYVYTRPIHFQQVSVKYSIYHGALRNILNICKCGFNFQCQMVLLLTNTHCMVVWCPINSQLLCIMVHSRSPSYITDADHHFQGHLVHLIDAMPCQYKYSCIPQSCK